MAEELCLGVVPSTRGFFPDHLVKEGVPKVFQVMQESGIEIVAPTPDQVPLGAVESFAHAQICADWLKAYRDKIKGVIVVLPNFGDERAVAETIKLAGLDVPILVQAFADDPKAMGLANRRDSFCGKISICNNLAQYDFPFSLTDNHTVAPDTDAFKDDLRWFMAVCRVVAGLRNARLGAIGARPPAFNTVRFSEKILQFAGVSVVTIDLSDIFAMVDKLTDDDTQVQRRIERFAEHYKVDGVPREALLKMAKLAKVIDDWMQENALVASALQCWTSMEENFGICPCGLMGMMTESLIPSACEVDITGVITMLCMMLASGIPAALADWNNNYGDDPDKAVVFHCSNWPPSMLGEEPTMVFQDIISKTVGEENAFGACVGRTPAGPMTFARLTTADTEGKIKGYVGQGEFTDDALDTFGGRAVVKIIGLKRLMHYICKKGFEHHVVISNGGWADALYEAWTTYLDWNIHYHGEPGRIFVE